MLKYAIIYENELNEIYQKIILGNEKYLYWDHTYSNLKLKLRENDWEYLQLVSIVNNKIIGYINIKFDRDINAVSNISAISFDIGNIYFLYDLLASVDLIFCKRNMSKIIINFYKKNPYAKVWELFIGIFRMRYIGYYENNRKLKNGKLVDELVFEIKKKSYLKIKNEILKTKDANHNIRLFQKIYNKIGVNCESML
ncbi:MAG: hypothetical protein WC934_13015 [Acidithiobacillus sp.]|jgi:hypothetical protein|uniref:hypothetical protein n=1 Tax=Acidithiobacillus sp. TaxID=1872118 RepID=UPI003560B0BF